jgi:hypothetical protein
MKAKPISKVSKRTTPNDKLAANRWRAFCTGCQIPFEELSDEWNTFFIRMGYTTVTDQELNDSIDAAMKGEGKWV